jgi:hypothetical protein
MGNVIIIILCVVFIVSAFLAPPSNQTPEAPPPPDANYVFKKEKLVQPSSEAVATPSREEILVQCKKEYDLAKIIMTNHQINIPMIKSLENIYKDPQFSEELKAVAKNAVVIAEEEDRYLIQSSRSQAIEKFANDAQKNCLKFN